MKKIILALFLIAFSGNIFSQRAISLTSPAGKKTWLINNGDRVSYEVKNNPLGYFRGRVDEVKDSSVIISGEEIKFSLIRMIKVPRHHAGRSIFLSLVFGGLAIELNPINDANGKIAPPDAIAITEGVLGAASAYYLIKGIVELAVRHKCYMDKGWKMNSVTLAELKREG